MEVRLLYRIGLDVGSTTLKCVVLDESNSVVYKNYMRHRSMIREIALSFLQDIKKITKNSEISIAITGSAGMGLSESFHLPFIQEVIATQLIVEERYPDIDVVIELGGEDAKILFLSNGLEVRMNGSCAGGTGAFIDQMTALLDMDISDFDKIALEANYIYPIASRCGVFAKTDVQPLLNQGAEKKNVAMSIYHAVVNQTIGGLAQGREIKGKIMFLGGPLTFLKGLQEAFRTLLNQPNENYFFPENGQYFVALGAAMYSGDVEKRTIDSLISELQSEHQEVRSESHIPALFENEKDYEIFKARHAMSSPKRLDLASYEGKTYLGIDAGSTTIKLVLLGENGEILYQMYQASNGKPLDIIKETLVDVYHIKPDLVISSSAVTGYGEDLIKSAFKLDFGLVETIAHLTAAQQFMPEVDFIIDIGGQDMKCFKIRDGAIDTIFLNEACSSGCGSFISTFAHALGYDVESFANLGLFGKLPVDLGSRCTVFMNSSVKQAQKEGATVEDISAGVSISVVKNALYKVIRVNSIEDLGKNIVVQGGTFYNDAILRAFEREVDGEVIRPEIAGLMGAYGCAVYASNQDQNTSSVLKLDDLKKFSYQTELKQCDLCGNHCQLTINTFNHGEKLIAGNRCERPLLGDGKKKIPKITDSLNEYDYKRKKNVDLRKQKKLKNARGTIGIPLGLNIYEMYPFWNAFWRSLNFNVIFSPFSSKKLYLDGQQSIPSDTICYPAKLMHGHIKYLLKKNVDHIFYPCLSYNFDEKISDNHYNCPVVAYYPQVLDANIDDLKNASFLLPFYGVHNRKHFTKVIAEDMKKLANISSKEVKKAVQAAYEAQYEYYEDIQHFGENAIKVARENGKQIIVLAGRPYHIDPEINHGIDKIINSFDVAIVSEDAIPYKKINLETSVLNQWTYHARLYNAAKVVAASDDMSLIQLVSFGCGLDAITTDEVREILESQESVYTQIKIDEINNLGAVKIRLRSLFATLNRKRRNK